VLKEFDDRRVASLHDIKTRDESEWRFIGNDKRDVLDFAPVDVRFLLVEVWSQALRWNRRLNSSKQKHLLPYGRAGVMAIRVELILGAPPDHRRA
jgi:hypothetical protein